MRQRGSEALLLRIDPASGRRECHVLSHKCCKSKSAVVWDDHVASIKRKFGLTAADLK